MTERRRRDLLMALEAHEPSDRREARAWSRTRALVRWLPDPFDEDADPTHVTAAGIVLDPAGRVLLHRHKRLGIWLQPGGHVDPDEAPSAAALREVAEETGLDAIHPENGPRLVHVDVHEGPRGHVHLDLCYLLHADGHAPFAPAEGESSEVAWVDTAIAPIRCDAGLAGAIAAARRAWHPPDELSPGVPSVASGRRQGGRR